MIAFKHVYNYYIAPLKGLTSIETEESSVLLKFDTGAAKTVISIGKLAGEIIPEEKLSNKLKTLLSKRPSITQVTFESASGNTITGIKACAKSVKLDGVLIPTFCYYLVFDVGKKALLGDDFISKCDFKHSKDGDICITSFDRDAYEEECTISDAIDSCELCELIFSDEEPTGNQGEAISQEEINSILFGEPKKIEI